MPPRRFCHESWLSPLLKAILSFAGLLLLAAVAAAQEIQGSQSATAFYHGTIGCALEVQMTLTRHGSVLTGSYGYESQRKPIALRGRVLPSGDYEIDELDVSPQAASRFSVNQVFA